MEEKEIKRFDVSTVLWILSAAALVGAVIVAW